MNKTDLINEVAFKMGVPRYQSLKFINTFEAVLADAIRGDNPLMLQGFGTFLRGNRPSGWGVTPGQVLPV